MAHLRNNVRQTTIVTIFLYHSILLSPLATPSNSTGYTFHNSLIILLCNWSWIFEFFHFCLTNKITTPYYFGAQPLKFAWQPVTEGVYLRFVVSVPIDRWPWFLYARYSFNNTHTHRFIHGFVPLVGGVYTTRRASPLIKEHQANFVSFHDYVHAWCVTYIAEYAVLVTLRARVGSLGKPPR